MIKVRHPRGRASIFLFAAVIIHCGLPSLFPRLSHGLFAESRVTVVNPFALTEAMGWQYGLEAEPDTPPSRWTNTTLPRFVRDRKVIWYRLRFITRARPRVPLGIMPGRVTSTDRAYLNGQLIGSTGREGRGAFGRLRLYYLPVELLKIASGPDGAPGDVNEFLIRVQGLPGESGIIAGPHRTGPLLLLRERARGETLPALLLAALLFAAAMLTFVGLRNARGDFARLWFGSVLFAGALFLSLAGDTSVQEFFSFRAARRMEFIALCFLFAFIAPAIFATSPPGDSSAPSANSPVRAVAGLVWMPAVLLLPAAAIIALSDDYETWFLIRDRLLKPIALTAGPALALRGGFLFFKRRSSDTLFLFLGPTMLSAALILDLHPDFRLHQGVGLLLFGLGLLVTALPLRSRGPASSHEPERADSMPVSEHRRPQEEPPAPAEPVSGKALKSEQAEISIQVPQGDAAAAIAETIRLAGRPYFALIMAAPLEDRSRADFFTLAAEQALHRHEEPLLSESTFPETWLHSYLSEFRQLLNQGAPAPDHSMLFLALLDPGTGYLYHAGVGTPTIESSRDSRPYQDGVGTPTGESEIMIHGMASRESIRVAMKESGSGAPGPIAEIHRRGEAPGPDRPDESTRARMRASLEEARRGKRAEAIALYEELHMRQPRSESIAQNLALLHIKERNLWRAARLYEHCSRLNPAVEKYIYQAALAYYRDKHYARAAALTERLILRNPRNLEGLLLLCELMRLLDHEKRAGELLERARNIAADDPRVLKMSKMMSS